MLWIQGPGSHSNMGILKFVHFFQLLVDFIIIRISWQQCFVYKFFYSSISLMNYFHMYKLVMFVVFNISQHIYEKPCLKSLCVYFEFLYSVLSVRKRYITLFRHHQHDNTIAPGDSHESRQQTGRNQLSILANWSLHSFLLVSEHNCENHTRCYVRLSAQMVLFEI